MKTGIAHLHGSGRRWVCLLVLLPALFLAGTSLAAAEKRVALVIGNSEYAHVSNLSNPANDAEDLSMSLKRIGFRVTTGLNLDYNAMRLAIRDFTEAAADADIVIIYFAGHGIEIENTNYLIPVNAALRSDRDVEFEAIRLDAIVNAVADTPGLKIVLVDACRNNPFVGQMTRVSATRSIGSGLAAIEPGGVVVGYAARGGTLAQDGDGRNSPYAKALLEHIEQPGLELGKLFRRVRDRVFSLTDGFQEPFTYGSLPGDDIYLVPKTQQVALIPEAPGPAPAPTPPPVTETDIRAAAVRVNTLRGWSLFSRKVGAEALTDPEIITRMTEMVPLWISASDRQKMLEQVLLPDREARKAVQNGLNGRGIDVGSVDGAFGAKTRAGIKVLQAQLGLSETGMVDPGVMSGLGIDWIPRPDEDFISGAFATRHFPEMLKVLGEHPEIVRSLACLDLRKSVYGVFERRFYVVVLKSGNVVSARREAQNCGLDLATITSARENEFIVDMFRSDPAFVSVGYDSKTGISYKSGPYFGFRKDPGEEDAKIGWRWYSGEPVNYTNWLPSKPNLKHDRSRKQFAQFQYEKRGRSDLKHVVPSKWFDGSGAYGQAFVLEGALP
jgi:hypothetical protein